MNNKPTIVVEESLYKQAKECCGDMYEIIVADSMPYE